jgi:hypothetical protein
LGFRLCMFNYRCMEILADTTHAICADESLLFCQLLSEGILFWEIIQYMCGSTTHLTFTLSLVLGQSDWWWQFLYPYHDSALCSIE